MNKNRRTRSILLIRITAIGDIVMSSPVASALKRNDPNTHITWVVHPAFASLLEDHPDIDEVITFDADEWTTLWKQKRLPALYKKVRELKNKLRKRNYERAIDLQGRFTTGFIAWLSKAPHKIALGSEGGNSWFMTKTISRNLGDQTQIGSEYRYLINQLGCSDAYWKMHVPRSQQAETNAKNKLKEKLGDSDYAVICPFAQFPQKNWFEDYWEQIILRIRGRYHLRTVIVGGINGKGAGEKMAKMSGAINLAGETSLEETASVIAGASLLIGVDTGLTHMGHALNIPTISLFGATYPYDYVDSDISKVIYLDRFCSPCRRNPTCQGKFQCMREITPDNVLTVIKPLIQKTSGPNAAISSS